MHKSKAPAFQFYYRDFATSTAFMSGEAVGALIQMLGLQFEHGGIPNDVAMLARATRCSEKAVEEAMTKFDLSDDGKLRNARMVAIIADMEEYRQQQAKNSGQRWNRKKKKEKHPVGIPSHSHGIPDAIPSDMPNASPPSASASAPSSSSVSPTPKEISLRHPPQKSEVSQTPKPRDPIWDAVADSWYGGTVIADECAAVGKIVRGFKQHNATADEIRKRKEQWPRIFPQATCTARATLKHWHLLQPQTLADPRYANVPPRKQVQNG